MGNKKIVITFQSLCLYLLRLHKCKGHRASIFLFIFWFILTFCAIPQLRWEINNVEINFTYQYSWWRSYYFLSYTTFFILISVMTILSAFHDKAPINSTYPKYEKPSPQLKAGPLNQLFFSWFSKTTWIGFKRPLIIDDIYDVNPQFASNELVPVFEKNFQESIQKNTKINSENSKGTPSANNTTTNGSVLSALWYSFGGHLMFSLFLRIIIDLIQFAQPFLLGKWHLSVYV